MAVDFETFLLEALKRRIEMERLRVQRASQQILFYGLEGNNSTCTREMSR